MKKFELSLVKNVGIVVPTVKMQLMFRKTDLKVLGCTGVLNCLTNWLWSIPSMRLKKQKFSIFCSNLHINTNISLSIIF